jgi:hypothetical protein
VTEPEKPTPSLLPPWLDENRDGVPDPWIARVAWWLAATIVRGLAPSHTIVRRAVEDIDRNLPR